MSRDDVYDIIMLAAAFVLFFEIGVFVGRRIERIMILSYLIKYSKKEEKLNESNSISTE